MIRQPRQRRILFFPTVLLFVVLPLLSSSQTHLAWISREQDRGIPLPDPHKHVVPVHEEPWDTELAPEVKLLRFAAPSSGGSDSVLSPDGRWRAFVFTAPDESGGRVCIEEVRSRKQYQLVGIPLPYRPLSDLVWLDADRLAFDRWSQPHYGIHYVVDMKKHRLALAAPFPDEFFLRQQKDSTR